MQVFKLYYKIFIKRSFAPTIMYVAIFMAMTIAFSMNATSSQEKMFSTRKCGVSIIDNDKSVLSTELSNYVKANSKYIEISDVSDEGLKDALFFRSTEYIIIIPKNFGDKFFTDGKLSLQTMRIPNSASGNFLDTMINKYLNTAELYNKADIPLDESLKRLGEDLSIETNVKFANGDKTASMPAFSYYFNYLVYPLVSIFVLIISGTTLAINETDVKRRNIGSPVSTSRFSFGLFLANSSIAIVIYAVFLVLAAVMYKDSLLTQVGMLTIVNGLAFTILSLSLCFLISNIVNNKTVSGISTVLSLLMCFTGGVFVPQQLLSESVKNVAVINPAFWYVKANNTLGNLSTLNFDNLKPVMSAYAIQICFAIAFLAISLVLIKQKRTSES